MSESNESQKRLDFDLRTRITDAIWDEARTIGSTLSLKASGLIADAVIRELKLDQPVDFTSAAWGTDDE